MISAAVAYPAWEESTAIAIVRPQPAHELDGNFFTFLKQSESNGEPLCWIDRLGFSLEKKAKEVKKFTFLRNWQIRHIERATPAMLSMILKMEAALSPEIEKFDFGEIMENHNTYVSLILSESLRINLNVYDGDFSTFYLTYYSMGKPVRQDLLDFNETIEAFRAVRNALNNRQ